jgi:hypothetical protein
MYRSIPGPIEAPIPGTKFQNRIGCRPIVARDLPSDRYAAATFRRRTLAARAPACGIEIVR